MRNSEIHGAEKGSLRKLVLEVISMAVEVVINACLGVFESNGVPMYKYKHSRVCMALAGRPTLPTTEKA